MSKILLMWAALGMVGTISTALLFLVLWRLEADDASTVRQRLQASQQELADYQEKISELNSDVDDLRTEVTNLSN